MANVVGKESIQDGRMPPLEAVLEGDEKPLKEKTAKKALVAELKVGEWFLIDRDIIDRNKEEICRKCNEAGTKGKALWRRFEKSNKIADENFEQYPRIIETYIFEHNWEYKTEREMREMCEKIGKGMCDEIICYLELQMRICNGESVDDLTNKPDKLPYRRLIRLRNGGTGQFGHGFNGYGNFPPARLRRYTYTPRFKNEWGTPYAYR